MYVDFNEHKTSVAAIDNATKARHFFAKPETLAEITKQADSVRDWMIRNKGKTGKAGDEITGAPWWPQLSETTDDDRLDLRLDSLRTLIFGHGLRRLLNRMIDVGLIAPTMKKHLDRVTEYQYMQVHYQLIDFSRADKPQDVNLTFIRNAFNLSERTSPTKVRDSSFGRMVLLGLWEADYDGQNSSIRAGATAKIFHHKIFTPVRQRFQKTLQGGKIAAALVIIAVAVATISAGADVVVPNSPASQQYANHPSERVPT